MADASTASPTRPAIAATGRCSNAWRGFCLGTRRGSPAICCGLEQTAEAIWAAGYGDGVALHRLPELAEQDLGTWQGEDRAAFFASRVPSPSSYWFASAEERAPGGESFTDVVARVGAAVERLTGEYRGRDIVAVGHGGSIRAAMVAAMGMTPQRVLGVAVENCSVSRFDHYQGEGEAGWRTVMINHQPWLDGGGAKESAAGADKPA